MTRTIRLSRIHALNWYGYQDSIPVEGNLLLAGVTGSGKTALMDLIQLVLIGDQRLVSFNKSATGDRSDRTLKGYCLGDTKEEDNGAVQYMRNSVITYAGLEFTWPRGNRYETWGIRVEFASAAEIQGKITPFHVPCRLERSNFLDTDKRPLDFTEFRALVEMRGGRLYTEGLDSYLRDMAQTAHLNFDRSVLRSLLPSAMSFTFLRSFNEFCRHFILPSDRLDITNVTASYRSFLAYERDLKNLDDQLGRLEEISAIFNRVGLLRRDKALSRYLEAELYYEHAQDLLIRAEAELTTIKDVHILEENRLNELDQTLPELERQISGVSASINATPEGQLYSELKSQQDHMNQRIGHLKEVGSTLEAALAHRIQRAKSWISELKSISVSFDPSVADRLEYAVHTAEQNGIYDIDKSLARVADAARIALTEVMNAARPLLNKLGDARKRIAQLTAEIGALRIGRLPFPTRLLDTLSDRLPSLGSRQGAQHLRELCEVVDEYWRPAIEVAFTRKFAVVVAADDYNLAEKIYSEMSAAELGDQLGRESLINPTKALTFGGIAKKGSLAEKIRTTHPVADAIVRHLFGNLICIERVEHLREYEYAILPDGFMTRGAFMERRRFYDGLPFVGKKGLQQQLAWKENELAVHKAAEQQLAPIETDIKGLQDHWDERFGLTSSIYADLARAKELPNLEADVAHVKERLRTIDRSQFDRLARQQIELESKLATLRAEQRELLRSPHRAQLQNCESALRGRKKELAPAKDEFDRVRFAEDISLWVESLATLRTDMLTQYPVKDIAARKCGEMYHQRDRDDAAGWEELKAKRREIAINHSKFQELGIESADNTAYERQLAKLRESEIPEYTEKAKIERSRWEGLFRTQVLEKLHSALHEVIDQVYLLNSALKQHPIGNDRYQLRYWNNPDFKVYHELIEANALAREDELFFSSAEPRFRDAICQFLELLTEKPDSVEASRLLDYRCYYEYDMEVIEADGRKTSVDRQSGKFSGGENQSPYFIAILASYLRGYRRYSSRRSDPTLGLVPIDEAFSKLSGERIKDCIRALRAFDLQGVFSMSTGNIPYALDQCDWLVAVSKRESRVGKRLKISNIPISIGSESDDARQLVQF